MKICPHCQALYATQFTHCPKDGHALRPATELTAGTVIRGKYQILEKIGAGGMGVVYKARHVRFDEVCALKLVSSSLAQDPTFLQRFNTEALMMRRLDHPHALRVNDIDETEDGTPFIVMEYVEGDNLAHLLRDGRTLEPERAARITMQVCDALAAAHRLGIIHRDIKPANILLARAPGGDHVKVFDFGIAKVKEGSPLGGGASLTQTGMLVGTPAYMSPEQCQGARGEQLDGRTDLYSVGIVLYEMLTGTVPFSAQTPVALLLAHMQERPRDPRRVRPELPQPIVDVVFRALEKDPAQRFQSAEEMREALQAALTAMADPNRTVAVMPRRTPAPVSVEQQPGATERLITPQPSPSPDAVETQHIVTPPRVPAPQSHAAAAVPAAPTVAEEAASWTAPRPFIPRWIYAAAGSFAVLVLVVVASYRMGFIGSTSPDLASAPPASTMAEPPNAAPAAPPMTPGSQPAKGSEAGARPAAPTVDTTQIIMRPETKVPPGAPAQPTSAEPPPAKAEPAKAGTAPQPLQPAATKAVEPQPSATAGPPASAPRMSADEAQMAALKTHFENGRRAVEQARTLRSEIARAPAGERPALEEKLAAARQAAIRHFESARQSLPPQDPNRHVVLSNLAQAYELAGRDADAAAAYEEAARLKPENGAYFLGWGTALARLGRNREAGEACVRVASRDPVTGGACWLNVGVVLYTSGKGPEAVGPLRRATQLQPANAQAWYVLGASLVSSMDFRRSGDRVVPVLAEGTDDAYNRYLQLEPGGRFAAEARAALLALAAIRPGIERRIGRPSLRGEPKAVPRAGKDVPEARPVEQPAPAYPVLARHARVQGEVQVLAVIGRDGSVLDVEAQSGPPLLYTAALEAVRKWRYQPVLEKNKPIEASTLVSVRFNLQR